MEYIILDFKDIYYIIKAIIKCEAFNKARPEQGKRKEEFNWAAEALFVCK